MRILTRMIPNSQTILKDTDILISYTFFSSVIRIKIIVIVSLIFILFFAIFQMFNIKIISVFSVPKLENIRFSE